MTGAAEDSAVYPTLLRTRTGSNEAIKPEAKAQVAHEAALGIASRGKRVAIMTCGSRGDVQPFVALAAGLAEAGFPVLVLTNANHITFAKSFGVEAVEFYTDAEQLVLNDPGVLACMKNGDMLKFMKVIGELSLAFTEPHVRQTLAALEEFRPDLILHGLLCNTTAEAICGVRGIPNIQVDLAGYVPSGSGPSWLNEPEWAPAWVHRAFHRLLMWAQLRSDRMGKYPFFAEIFPEGMPYLPKNMEQLDLLEEYRSAPMLVASSPMLCKRADDWAWDVEVTGHWVVGPEEQEQRMRQGEANFAQCGELADFLAGGPAPVYVGWGSMVCVSSEFMACIAVRALKLAGLRGVILGGWANLNMELLKGQPDSKELLEYAARHVLFMRTAPHEWLLPRCAASVHHGGAGTTAAALRSGRPTIVTPCGFEQPFHARNVANSGAGLALPRLATVTPEMLAIALQRVTCDTALIARARDFGAQLRAEDGVKRTVRIIDDFMAKEVSTGKWAARSARMHTKMREYDSPGLLTRLGFLCAKLCTNKVGSQVRW